MIDLSCPKALPPIWSEESDGIPEQVNVVCVFWGKKYPKYYIEKLRNGVNRNLSNTNYIFYCITDDEVPEGVTQLKPSNNWGTWWQKINLFNPEVVPIGLTLYIDLDSVIVGDLEDLLCQKSKFPIIMATNPSPTNRPICAHNSSVMLFESGDPRITKIYDNFKDNSNYIMKELHGDQCLIWRILINNIANFPGNLVRSYKYHCRNKLPQGTSVVFFHGKPDPHEVNNNWVKKHWK